MIEDVKMRTVSVIVAVYKRLGCVDFIIHIIDFKSLQVQLSLFSLQVICQIWLYDWLTITFCFLYKGTTVINICLLSQYLFAWPYSLYKGNCDFHCQLIFWLISLLIIWSIKCKDIVKGRHLSIACFIQSPVQNPKIFR